MTFNGRSVFSQPLERQKIGNLRFFRTRQDDFAQLGRQQPRKRGGGNNAQQTDQNFARSQTLNKNAENTVREQVSLLCFYKY